MISNTQQKVGEGYSNNPFWAQDIEDEAIVLDYEAELVKTIESIDMETDPESAFEALELVLVEALMHLGWDNLVRAFLSKASES